MLQPWKSACGLFAEKFREKNILLKLAEVIFGLLSVWRNQFCETLLNSGLKSFYFIFCTSCGYPGSKVARGVWFQPQPDAMTIIPR